MLKVGQWRSLIQRLVFGDTLVPQAFTVGLENPQTEIKVWLQVWERPSTLPIDIPWRVPTHLPFVSLSIKSKSSLKLTFESCH